MASEEIVTNETLSGRIFKPPRTLALTSDGSLRLPPGSVIDFALANQVVLPENLRTEIRDEIISQVSTDYLNGNLVHQNTNSSATDAVSTVLLGNNNADITGNTGLNDASYDTVFSSLNSFMNGAVTNSQISSSSGSYIVNGSAPPISYLDIDSSQGSYLQNTTTGASPTLCSISGCSGCYMDDTQGTTTTCCLHGSNTSSIRGGTGNTIIGSANSSSQRCTRGSLLACDSTNVTDLINSALAGTNTTITNFTNPLSAGDRSRIFVGGSTATTLIGGPLNQIGVLWGSTNTVSSNVAPVTANNRIAMAGIISSGSCSLTHSTNPNSAIFYSLIQSSSNSSINGNSATVASGLISGSDSCNISGGNRSSVTSSSSSTATGLTNSSLIASQSTTVSDLTNSAILADQGSTSTFTNPLPFGERSRVFVAGGNSNSLIGGGMINCGMLWSTTCYLQSDVAPVAATNRISVCGITASTQSGMIFNTNPNSNIQTSSIVASGVCVIGANNTNVATTIIEASSGCNVNGGFRQAIIASGSSTLTNNSSAVALGCNAATLSTNTRCLALGGNGPSITTSTDCITLGSGSTITSRTNCLSWNGGTLTGDNQASFGGSTRFAGNMVQTTGYVQPYSGVANTVRSSAVNTTLALGDRTIILTGTANLTLPLASTFGANYPLNTEVKFKIIRTGTTNTISTTSPDTFNNVAGFGSESSTLRNTTIEILLVNTTVSPHWRFADRYVGNLFCGSMVTDNTFGTTPVPKSDAAQLPTSTSQATHEALGATSYVYFEGFYGGGSTATLLVPPAAVPGIQLLPGLWKITYRYTVRTTSGGGNYRLRSDVRNNQSGLTIIGSYAETDGTNAIGGTRTVTVVCPEVAVTAQTIFTLRLSQDATSTISATAAISDPCFDIVGYL